MRFCTSTSHCVPCKALARRCYDCGHHPACTAHHELRREDGLLRGVIRRQRVRVKQRGADALLLPVGAVGAGAAALPGPAGRSVRLRPAAAGPAAVLHPAAARVSGEGAQTVQNRTVAGAAAQVTYSNRQNWLLVCIS